MRKLIFGINVTVDGCCDHTRGIPNEEVHDYFALQVRHADTLLYGRKTYELMVPFWPDVAKNPGEMPKSMIEFAKAFDSVSKIVVCSRTLEEVEGKKTSIIRSNLKDEILKLKREAGGNILTGGVDIPGQLIQLGLVDEINIVVHPVVAGAGRRLWDDLSLPEMIGLELVESKTFKAGHVASRYSRI